MGNAKIVTLVTAVLLFGTPSVAVAAKAARCDVFMSGQQYTGECEKKVQKNGAIELILSDSHEAQLNENLYALYLTPSANKKYKVIGNYNEGGEEWGVFSTSGVEMLNEIQRSQCWESEEVTFCVIE